MFLSQRTLLRMLCPSPTVLFYPRPRLLPQSLPRVFCPTLYFSPPAWISTPLALTSLPSLSCSPPVRLSSQCFLFLPSLLSLFCFSIPTSSVIFPLVLLAPWFPCFSVTSCSWLSREGAHPGVPASRRILFARFVWPGLAKGVGL